MLQDVFSTINENLHTHADLEVKTVSHVAR